MGGKIEIIEERVIRRRNVSELARRVGRDHSHISRVLSGERAPGEELGRRLRKLGVRFGKGDGFPGGVFPAGL